MEFEIVTKSKMVKVEEKVVQDGSVYFLEDGKKLKELVDPVSMIGLEKMIKKSGESLIDWASRNSITQNGSLKLRKSGAIVINGQVYRPTNYTVVPAYESNSDSKKG